MANHVVLPIGDEMKMDAIVVDSIHYIVFSPLIKKYYFPPTLILNHAERDKNTLKLFFEEGEEIVLLDFFSFPENQWPDFVFNSGLEVNSALLLEGMLPSSDSSFLEENFAHGRLHPYYDDIPNPLETSDGIVGIPNVKSHGLLDQVAKNTGPIFFSYLSVYSKPLYVSGKRESPADERTDPQPDDPMPPLTDGEDIPDKPLETIGYLGRIIMHSLDAAIDQISCCLYDSKNMQLTGSESFDPVTIVLSNKLFRVTGYDARSGKVFFDLTREGRTFAMANPEAVLIDYATFLVDGRSYSIQLQLNRQSDYDSHKEDASSTQIGIAENDFIGEWHYEADANHISLFSNSSKARYACMGRLFGSELDFSQATDTIIEVGKTISNSVVRCGLGQSTIVAKEFLAFGTATTQAANYASFTSGVVHINSSSVAMRSENGVNRISGCVGEIKITSQGKGSAYGLYAAGDGRFISSNTVILNRPEASGLISISVASVGESRDMLSVVGVFAGKNALNVLSVKQGEISINVKSTSSAMGICSAGGVTLRNQLPGQKFGNLLAASKITLVVSGSDRSVGVFASEGGVCDIEANTGINIQVQAAFGAWHSIASGIFVSGSRVILQARDSIIIHSSKANVATAVDCAGNNAFAYCTLISSLGDIRLAADGIVAIGICGRGLASTRVSAQNNFRLTANASTGYAGGILGKKPNNLAGKSANQNSSNVVTAGNSIWISVHSNGNSNGLFLTALESPLLAVGVFASGPGMYNLLSVKKAFSIRAVSEFASAAGLVAEDGAINKIENHTGGAIDIFVSSNAGDHASSALGSRNAYGLLAVGSGSNCIENGNSFDAQTAIEVLAKGANSNAYVLCATGADGADDILASNVVSGKEGSVILSAYSTEGAAYCMFANNGGINLIDFAHSSDGMRLEMTAKSPDGKAYGMYAESGGRNTIQGSIFGDTISISGNLFSSSSSGGKGGNQIFADDGDDYIHIRGNISGSGNLIAGGNGNDTIILEGAVEPGSVTLRGGRGEDVLILKATDIDTFFEWYDAWISSLSPAELRQMSFERIELHIGGITELDERLLWLEDYFGVGNVHVVPISGPDLPVVDVGQMDTCSLSVSEDKTVPQKKANLPADVIFLADTESIESLLGSQEALMHWEGTVQANIETGVFSSFSLLNDLFQSTESALAYFLNLADALSLK